MKQHPQMSSSAAIKPTTITFVHHPVSEFEFESNKKTVRSHVTRQQHARSRTASRFRPSTKLQSKGDSSASYRALAAAPESPQVPALPVDSLEVAFSRGTKAFSTFTLCDTDSNVSRCLDNLGFDMAAVIRRWKVIVSFWARGETHLPQDLAIRNASHFFDLTFGDPVLLTAAILLTVRQLCRINGSPGTDRQRIAVLKLEQYLISSINEAMRQGARGISNHMMVAIALCSTHELLYGSVSTYKMHMRGLISMIQARGGLSAIESSDEFCRDWLIWHDIKTSPRLGEGLFFNRLPGYSVVEAR